MSYLVKSLFLLLVLSLQVQGGTVTPLGVMGLVLLCALWIVREKYLSNSLLMVIEYSLVVAQGIINPMSLLLMAVLAYDLTARGMYWQTVFLLPAGYYFFPGGAELIIYVLALILCAFCGHLRYTLDKREASFLEVYDRERKDRYSLEKAKARLMASTREAAHLAEIKERNRIAREIHDSLGHDLTGILLQLQAAAKLLDRDEAKARQLLQKSVTGLAESVDLLRDTVHNIRPREELGLKYFQKVVDNFHFCPVDFQHMGDLSALSPSHSQLISTLIKEALTNASRYSQATKVEINLEVRKKIVRLQIRDNGVGSEKIQDGMGLSGMKERVRNAGGTITISSRDGFMIVCVLPREEGGFAIADHHS